MRIVMLDSSTIGDDIDLSPAKKYGEFVSYSSSDAQNVSDRIKDADIVIVNKVKLTENVLKSAENLKLICVTATGYDNVDTDYCKKNNIAVTNTPAYSTNCVTQVTVSVACNLMTHLSDYTDYVKSGEYSKGVNANRIYPVYNEFYGKTWGIIGYGNIGKSVASVAKALGCNILINKKYADENCVDIDYLIRNSDIISIHCPLNGETRNLIDKKEIALLKKNAIIINMARGAVWNEKEIADAFLKGQFAGLGCDVYTDEPFRENHPFYGLLGMKNVCFTPHMAWCGFETRKRCFDIVLSNIDAFLKGQIKNRI